MTIEELEKYKPKLESLTQATNGCWFWLGTKEKSGRGKIRVGKKMKNTATMAWELSNGQNLPEGCQIKSICETPACIRPDHLECVRRTFPWRA